MPTLTLSHDEPKKGTPPLAIVRSDGPDNGQLLTCSTTFDDTEDEPTRRASVRTCTRKHNKETFTIDPARYKADLKRLKPTQRLQAVYGLQQCLDADEPAECVPEELRALYARIRTDARAADDKRGHRIDLPIGSTFAIVPDPAHRSVIYAAAASNSGKSWAAADYARRYLQCHADEERIVYVISALEEGSEPAFAKLGPRLKYIPIESLIKEPIKAEDVPGLFTKSLVILDDADCVDKKEMAALSVLQNALCTIGRKAEISVFFCVHRACAGSNTALILNETQQFLIFPHGLSAHVQMYLLSKYASMSKEEIASLRTLKSRWVCVNTRFPRTMVWESGAATLT